MFTYLLALLCLILGILFVRERRLSGRCLSEISGLRRIVSKYEDLNERRKSLEDHMLQANESLSDARREELMNFARERIRAIMYAEACFNLEGFVEQIMDRLASTKEKSTEAMTYVKNMISLCMCEARERYIDKLKDMVADERDDLRGAVLDMLDELEQSIDKDKARKQT